MYRVCKVIYSVVFLFILLILINNAKGEGKTFYFKIENNGSYSLYINSKLWLESGPTFFNALGETWSTDSTDNPLILSNVRNVTGGSVVEQWYETQFTYRLGNTTTSVMAAVRLYDGIYRRVLFTQTFLTGALNTSRSPTSQNETLSGFPCLQVKRSDEELGFLSYGGYMFGYTDMKMSTFDSTTDHINDGMTGGPLAVFNRDGNTVVLSPYNNFMAASAWHIGKPGGHVCWGIMGGVNEIPANFSYSTMLVYDDGVNQAFETWGQQLRNQFGIMNGLERERRQRNDISLNYLGYWTDNGAYYYYNPEHNKTYDATLTDVKAYASWYLIPYHYVELDSWWYKKDQAHDAVLTWTPMKSAFPDGIKNFTQKTEWPAVAHNRYWSNDTPYAKANGGNYTFVMGDISLPNDQEFWRFLLSRARDWGIIVYEQDWLNVQTQFLPELQTSLTLGHDWLKQMATAAAENNLTIQYCMSNPRHALQSMEFPVVTQARVSDDYLYESKVSRQPQWKVGVSSIFAKAMRIQPYKDTFWTISNQTGNPRYGNLTEPYPELESAVASLTAGPVGPSDMINKTNIGLIMKCCRKDGMLLKPSEPATAIDKQVIMDAFRPKGSPAIGDIWSTVSAINHNGRQMMYGILFAADIQGSISVGIDDLNFAGLREGVYYPYRNISAWGYFDNTTTFNLTGCSKELFCLFYFSPYLKGNSAVNALLGETVKWIPMSPQRISYVNLYNDGTLDVNFTRVTNQVMPQIVYILKGRLWSRDCLLDPSSVFPSCRLWEPPGFIARNGATNFNLILFYLISGACLIVKYCACV